MQSAYRLLITSFRVKIIRQFRDAMTRYVTKHCLMNQNDLDSNLNSNLYVIIPLFVNQITWRRVSSNRVTWLIWTTLFCKDSDTEKFVALATIHFRSHQSAKLLEGIFHVHLLSGRSSIKQIYTSIDQRQCLEKRNKSSVEKKKERKHYKFAILTKAFLLRCEQTHKSLRSL